MAVHAWAEPTWAAYTTVTFGEMAGGGLVWSAFGASIQSGIATKLGQLMWHYKSMPMFVSTNMFVLSGLQLQAC